MAGCSAGLRALASSFQKHWRPIFPASLSIGLYSRTMRYLSRRPLARLCCCLAAFACSISLSACAGSGNAVVAHVSDTAITQAAVSHWMNVLIGGDYYELAEQHVAPTGLVSDPPNYSRCTSRLRAILPGSTSSTLALLEKCHQLYLTMKEQATNYLIAAQWLVDLNRDIGVVAKNDEVLKLYANLKKTTFPTAAEQRRYLASQHLTLVDELFILRLDVLRNQDAHKVEAGGQKAYSIILTAEHRTDRTISCSAGYVVAHCPQYRGGDEQTYTTTPSPAVLVAQISAVSQGKCATLSGCLKH